MTPGGVRLGTAAVTSRGFFEEDMKTVASFLHQAVQLCLDIQVGRLCKLGDRLLFNFRAPPKELL